MAGEEEVLFALAGRIHVLLRRQTNRITDVEWMCRNALYANEVLKLARAEGSEELQKLVERVEDVHPLLPRIQRVVVAPIPEPTSSASKYVVSLR
ncbi:MAG: hypothetical protein PHP57_04980 [Sideroxydans sp.]|nr:hypothetical protein [Sideroxydans sp.]